MTKRYRFLLCNLTPNVISGPNGYIVLEPGNIELLGGLISVVGIFFAFGKKAAYRYILYFFEFR